MLEVGLDFELQVLVMDLPLPLCYLLVVLVVRVERESLWEAVGADIKNTRATRVSKFSRKIFLVFDAIDFFPLERIFSPALIIKYI